MSDHVENGIELPAPTAWPMVLAGGVTLLGAGYLMHPMLAIVGLAAVLLGCAGWFRDVLPVEREEIVPVVEQPPVARSPRGVLALRAGTNAHRMRLPLEVYPYSVGLKAGLAGGAAMAIVGCTFGLLTHGSIWYPINLLAAAGSATLTQAGTAELARFSPGGLILASVAHLSLSVLVGILYAALLPDLQPASDPDRGGVHAGADVRHHLGPAAGGEPVAEPAHRVDLVHRLASGVRRRCRVGRVPHRAYRDGAIPAAGGASRARGWRTRR